MNRKLYEISSRNAKYIPKTITKENRDKIIDIYCVDSVLIIPEGVQKIETEAFSGYDDLTDVYMPDSVTYLGNGAFMGCRWLTNVRFSKNLTYIPDRCFAWCTVLRGLEEFKDTQVIDICNDAFLQCINLKEIEFPDTVEFICKDAFHKCKFDRLNLANTNIAYLAEYAFSNCEYLSEIYLSGSLREISNGVFYNCRNLHTVHIYKNSDSVTLDEHAFNHAYKQLNVVFYDKTIQPNDKKESYNRILENKNIETWELVKRELLDRHKEDGSTFYGKVINLCLKETYETLKSFYGVDFPINKKIEDIEDDIVECVKELVNDGFIKDTINNYMSDYKNSEDDLSDLSNNDIKREMCNKLISAIKSVVKKIKK